MPAAETAPQTADARSRPRPGGKTTMSSDSDAALRAALLVACTLGLTLSRYLLDVPVLADATAADLHRALGPALRALVDAP